MAGMENWELREHQGQPQGEELLGQGWAQEPEPEAPEGSAENCSTQPRSE